MVQNENVVAIENNVKEIANVFKEKACLTWFKGTENLAKGKGKSSFKKAAEKRLEAFLAFASEEGDPANFAGNESLCEIARSAWAIAEAAAKADPTGATPMGALGIGLAISDPGSILLFKESLIQATMWAARQISNEAAQAAAKKAAQKAAEKDIASIFDAFFDEGVKEVWEDGKASDEALLNTAKILCLRVQKFLRQELEEIQKNGAGTVARAEAIHEEIRVIESDLYQGLSDKSLHAVDKDGVKIWVTGKLQPATTARRILENCQIHVSALQSKADRTLARLRATKGVGQITW